MVVLVGGDLGHAATGERRQPYAGKVRSRVFLQCLVVKCGLEKLGRECKVEDVAVCKTKTKKDLVVDQVWEKRVD